MFIRKAYIFAIQLDAKELWELNINLSKCKINYESVKSRIVLKVYLKQCKIWSRHLIYVLDTSNRILSSHWQQAWLLLSRIILLLMLSISCLCSTRDVYIQPSEDEHCPGTCYDINTFGKMAENLSNSSGLVVHFTAGACMACSPAPPIIICVGCV